jgi:hypothetical protein
MNYKDLLNQAPVTLVALGSQGIVLFNPEKLDEFQVGYSIHPNGTDLTGSDHGDWKKEWTVIGQDTLLHDPFFIETATPVYQVFTAMHGAGIWEPFPVSPSMEAFIHSLSELKDFVVTKDRSQLDQRIELSRKRLTEINGSSHMEFWDTLFESLIEEIEEQ